MFSILLISTILSASSVAITEPVDGETYNGNWLTVRAIVENENTLPDSVHCTLNGGDAVTVPRLNTDWYTYMANDCHTGYSESPAPMDNTIFWTAHVTGDSHEFPTPVVVDGIVYYPSNDGTDSLYAMNAATGEIIWSYLAGNTDDAVTVKNGYLYISSDSLWCLDAVTGERIWANGEAATGGASTPAVYDDAVFSCSSDSPTNSSTAYSLDTQTGDVNWSNKVSGFAASCLTVWNDMLFMPTYNGPLYAFNISNGEIIWQNTDAQNGYWDSSPVIAGGYLYILGISGKARAFDPLTGNTVWEATTFMPLGDMTATPAYHDGRLYFGDMDYSVGCLDATSGSVIWNVSGTIHGSPGVADGIMYYGEFLWNQQTAHFYALNCDNGEVVWSYPTNCGPFGIVSSPSIVDGVMYIAGTDWNLYAFGTGLKYTYLDDLYAQVGANELIVTSFAGGTAVAADTINFTVSGTGFTPETPRVFSITAGPNPFAVSADISFELPNSGYTSVSIFDLAGREVATLLDKETVQGAHSVSWNGSMQSGEEAPSGLYLIRIESGGVVETTGLCLLR